LNQDNKNTPFEETELPETPLKENQTTHSHTPNPPADPAEIAKGIYEWLETFCLALSLMVVLFLFVFKYVTVDGTSMFDTLDDGDKLIITSLESYGQGDIVVIREAGHEKPLVKRIIALEGQTVDIDFENWTVYVDGKPIDEPYIDKIAGTRMKSYGFSGHIVVEKGTVFVMGDNRNGSTDSRVLGCIDKRNILGKVVFRVYPMSGFGKVE
jgi:signal peptidase I